MSTKDMQLSVGPVIRVCVCVTDGEGAERLYYTVRGLRASLMGLRL